MLRHVLVALGLGLSAVSAPAASLCDSLDLRPLVKLTGQAWKPTTSLMAPVAGEVGRCTLQSGPQDSISVRVLVATSPSAPLKSTWERAAPIRALWPHAWYSDTVHDGSEVPMSKTVGAVRYKDGLVVLIDGVPVAGNPKDARKLLVTWLKAIGPK